MAKTNLGPLGKPAPKPPRGGRRGRLVALATGSATIAAILEAQGALAAAITAAPTVEAILTAKGAMAAALSGQASIAAVITWIGNIQGEAQLAGRGTISQAELKALGAFAAEVSGSGEIEAEIKGLGKLESAVAGISSVAADLGELEAGPIESALSGSGSVEANLKGAGKLTASVAGISTVAAILTAVERPSEAHAGGIVSLPLRRVRRRRYARFLAEAQANISGSSTIDAWLSKEIRLPIAAGIEASSTVSGRATGIARAAGHAQAVRPIGPRVRIVGQASAKMRPAAPKIAALVNITAVANGGSRVFATVMPLVGALFTGQAAVLQSLPRGRYSAWSGASFGGGSRLRGELAGVPGALRHLEEEDLALLGLSDDEELNLLLAA